MSAQLPIRIGLLLFIFAALAFQQTQAQVDPIAQDSLRAVEQIRIEQKSLTQELDRLQQELSKLEGEANSTERDGRIADVESRIAKTEKRLQTLESSLGVSATSPGDDSLDSSDEDWDDWEDDEGWSDDSGWEENDEWSWWQKDDGQEEQFDVESNFFQKFPGDFPWMFPMTSRLHESFFRYNRVEGAYIGLAQPKRLYWHSQPWLVSTASLGYGFANHTWRYSLGLYVPIYLENQIIEIGAEGHSLTDSKDQWSFDRDENTLTAIIAREDYLDYFERKGFTVSASWFYRGEDELNARASIGYAHDTYGNMNRNTDWSLFGGDKHFRPNPAINDGNINSLVFSAGATTLASLDERAHGWDAQVQYEMAGGFAAGDFEFTQIIADLRRYQPLSEHLNLNLRTRAGMSDGLIPQQRAFELGGPGTLPGYRFKEFSGSHVMLVSAEFIIRSSIVGNARGWAKSLLRNSNIIFFANAGSTNGALPRLGAVTDVTRGAFDVKLSDDFILNNWKSDIGVAFGSADGGFRIGAAWRLDRAESANFILRFSRPF